MLKKSGIFDYSRLAALTHGAALGAGAFRVEAVVSDAPGCRQDLLHGGAAQVLLGRSGSRASRVVAHEGAISLVGGDPANLGVSVPWVVGNPVAESIGVSHACPISSEQQPPEAGTSAERRTARLAAAG